MNVVKLRSELNEMEREEAMNEMKWVIAALAKSAFHYFYSIN